MDSEQLHKIHQEQVRWRILQSLHIGSPFPLRDALLLDAVGGDFPLTLHDIRREMDYLERRELIEVEGRGLPAGWSATLTRCGQDIVEYTVDCEAGIARPRKWD